MTNANTNQANIERATEYLEQLRREAVRQREAFLSGLSSRQTPGALAYGLECGAKEAVYADLMLVELLRMTEDIADGVFDMYIAETTESLLRYSPSCSTNLLVNAVDQVRHQVRKESRHIAKNIKAMMSL